MKKYGNYRVEKYTELLNQGKTSSEVYDIILNLFIKRNTRKEKIIKLFNLNESV
jgi:hypothetical protein